MAKLNIFAKLTNVEQATVVQGLVGVLYNLEGQVVGGGAGISETLEKVSVSTTFA
jgi:hypothetical protein